MHLSFVLVFALNIFAVMGYRNYYHASVESEELEEKDDPFIGNRCECRLIYRCPSGNKDLTVKCRNRAYVHCCYMVLQSAKPIEYQTPRPDQQSVNNTNGQFIWPSQQDSSHITTQFPTMITSSQPITRDPPAPLMTSQQILFTTRTTPPMTEIQTQLSAQITKPQIPVLTSSLTPITSTSPQPQLPSPSKTSPSSNVECVCTPFFICYDEETSSNLTNVVDDRSNIPSCQDTKPQKTCPVPNDVCCCNLEKPPQQPRQPRPSTTSPPKCEGNCRPINDCPDKSISGTDSEQGSCIDLDHVCCHELVLAVSPNTSNLSPPSNPQPSIPSEISPSANANECICTPFYNCYDPETSSNLTGVVNDRINQCPSTEVCCHNRIPPSVVPETTTDCSGSCIPIQKCNSLSDTLNAARRDDSDAIQKLRTLVCSSANGRANICCP